MTKQQALDSHWFSADYIEGMKTLRDLFDCWIFHDGIFNRQEIPMFKILGGRTGKVKVHPTKSVGKAAKWLDHIVCDPAVAIALDYQGALSGSSSALIRPVMIIYLMAE